MMDEHDDEIKLLPPKKKSKQSRDFSKCIICQDTSHDENLRNSTVTGLKAFQEAAFVRKDSTYERINWKSEDLSTLNIKWHGACYQTYTSKRNLAFVKESPAKNEVTDINSELPRTRARSQVKPIDWSMCMFCQMKKNKGFVKLLNVTTFDSCKVIEDAARIRNDENLLRNINGIDLIAAQAKYHKHCRSQYVSKSNLSYVESNVEEDVYTKAYEQLEEQVMPEIDSGKALDMKNLLESYQEILQSLGCATAHSYTTERLKRRLQNSFKETIIFHKLPNPSNPELVYSSTISLKDIINSASKTQSTGHTHIPKTDEMPWKNENTKSLIFYAAQCLRRIIKKETAGSGINIQPVDVNELSPCNAKVLLPDELYRFLSIVISNQDPLYSVIGDSDERRILAIGQDMIYATSHGEIKTPKHIGLAMSVRHMTGSKQLIRMLNRFGHSCSYDDIEVVDTSLALEIIARTENLGVVIPSNIRPGVFVQAAGDNNDINEETLDGKHTTHATTLVLYQRQPYGPNPKPVIHSNQKEKRRSLSSQSLTSNLIEFSASGKRPTVSSYKNIIQKEWFKSVAPVCSSAHQKDIAWFLTRICKNKLFSVDLHATLTDPVQSIPSWSGFNAKISTETPPLTSIGYCPMINGSATEYTTIYSVMKNLQAMMEALSQKYSVITFDLAIYMKAKEIQWRRPEEFLHTVIRIGGFHIALNFLAVIGKIYQDSGLEDLLVESGIYGNNTAAALLNGKSYNRGVRAHKLVVEAMLRLQWKAFGKWIEDNQAQPDTEDQCMALVNSCQNTVAADDGSLTTTFSQLCDNLSEVIPVFERFRKEAGEQSKLFMFWDMYVNIVLLLLRFIRAERDGCWELHLNTAAEMIPYFFSMDRLNYSRWLPVYIADMRLLPTRAPEVHREFEDGNHAVSRSHLPFSQVWTDMALEQTINLDSKTGGGIVGLTQNASALERWFITSHERAAITSATKRLCNLDDCDNIGHHKEAGPQRVKRDEEDVRKLLNTISASMCNPFETSTSDDPDPIPLRNIATGVVMPDDTANKLLTLFEHGKEQSKSFVSQRLDSNEVSFWSTMKKAKIKTFASLSKTAHIKCSDEKIITISADRNLFGRLLIAAKTREVDLKDVLSYELSSVPFALAHADGSLRKTTKSVLMSEMESVYPPVGSLPQAEIPTAFILDGMAMVQMLSTGGARTFGDLAEKHFTLITTPIRQRLCARVDVVFDRYDLPQSIKESERLRRGSSNALEINIANRNTPVPKQWQKFISNSKNKVNLISFLCKEWCEMAKSKLRRDQELIIGGGLTDPTLAIMISNGRSRTLDELKSDHEEADTRMILHASHASSSKARIVIHSPDTDVAILSIHFVHNMQCEELWFKTGVKDKVRFLPVHTIASKLGVSACSSLPGFHALTGCDSTSGLFQVGKKKAWKALLKDETTQDLVGNLGTIIPPSDGTIQSCERFICSMYATSKKAGRTADEVRYWMFCQKHQSSERLPPTSNSLRHHIERANYQSYIWKHSLQAVQELPSPSPNNGWKEVDGILQPELMSKDPAPKSLVELTTCSCKKSGCTRDTCSCKGNEMPCTEACSCMNDESCKNPYKSLEPAIESSDDDELSDE